MPKRSLVKHGARGSHQVHQNKVKFDPYRYKVDDQKVPPSLVATMTTLCCRRCCEILQWKVDYGKYIPLERHRKCNLCQRKTVTFAYHGICQECATVAVRCAKCQRPPTLRGLLEGAERGEDARNVEGDVEDGEKDCDRFLERVSAAGAPSKYAFVEQEDSDEEFWQLRGLDIRQLKRRKEEMKKQHEKDFIACLRERERRTVLRQATREHTQSEEIDDSDEEL